MTLTFRSPVSAYVWWCRWTSVGASTTTYISPEGWVPNATEVNQDRVIGSNWTFRWAYLRTSSTQSATGSLVCTYRKNGADQSIVITVAANSWAWLFSDLTNTFSCVAWDTVAQKLVQWLGSSAAITWTGVYFHWEDVNWSHPRTMLTSSWWAATVGSGATTYKDFIGSGYSATESIKQAIVPIAGLVRNLYIRTNSTQSAGWSMVVTFRLEWADTSLVATISAWWAAGSYFDVTNTVTVAAWDRIWLKFQNNAAATSCQVWADAVYIYDRFRKPRSALCSWQGNDSVAASSTEYTSGANWGSWNAAEGSRLAMTSIWWTLRDFYLVSNTAEPASGSVTFTYRVNQADTSLVITVAAGSAAGTYTDLTNTATVSAWDRIGIKWVKVSTSQSCTTRFGILLTE